MAAAGARSVTHVVGGQVALDDGTLAGRDVEAVDGVIRRVGPPGSLDDTNRHEVVDARGRIVAPGYVDVQLNGGWGHDFTTDPTSIAAVAERLPSTGVTAFVPTMITSSAEHRRRALEAWASFEPHPTAAAPLGWHFEGPMISPDRMGVHDRDRVALPSDVDRNGWRPDRGVAMVTLAPELPGACTAIEELVAGGVVVALGHTACSASDFRAARAAGATVVTHLFNAMAPFDHRAPGPVGATLADDGVVAGIICDLIHVDPVAIAVAWRALGPDRLLLVTDAMAALGTSLGTVRLGDVDVVVDERGARTSDGVLAGSVLSLDEAVRNLVDATGCAPAAAIRCATATPADVLGLTDRGRIRAGARADLVVLDAALGVERTIIGGTTVWTR